MSFSSNDLEHSFSIEYLYPFPISDLYRKFRFAKASSEKVAYALGLAEITLKLVTVLSMVASYDNPTTKLHIAKFRSRLGGATLGTWLNLLRSVSSVILDTADDTSLSSHLREMFRPRGSDKSDTFLSEFQRILEIRNAFIHGEPMTNPVSENFLRSISPSLIATLSYLSFLSRYRFAYCEETRKIRSPDCFESTIRLCNGSNPTFQFQVWELDSALDPFVPFLVSQNLDEIYKLYPFLTVQSLASNRSPQIGFFQKLGSHLVWQSYEGRGEATWTGTESEAGDINNFLAGTFPGTCVSLDFRSGRRPAWALDLSAKLMAPPGYEALGKIGAGRHAEVYKGIHSGLKQARAIKVLRRELVGDVIQRRRFEIEAQITSKLQSGKITPTIFEYGETGEGVPFIISEFVEGGSLEDYQNTWGPIGELEALDFSIRLFRLLREVHKSDILHRDIKPSNILVNGDDLLLCDFGSSLWQGEETRLTLDGAAFGTIGFMAAEQLAGRASRQSDIYSVGMCIIFLLAGHVGADARKWLFEEFSGAIEFRNILLSVIEPLESNRPLSASAVFERLSQLRARIRSPEGTAPTLAPLPAISADSHQARRRDRPSLPPEWMAPDGTVFCHVPAGEFLMGGSKFPDERPIHRVRITSDFFLASTPVTNRQFGVFEAQTGYANPNSKFLMHRRDHFSDKWRDPDCPVVFVSWRDAKQYILWRCEKDDCDYRLPTEAQWEYACRAGTQSVYYWGNTFDPLMVHADKEQGYPVPVGAYSANPWGLFDMLGNVWEWCEDLMDSAPHEESLFFRHCAEQADGIAFDPVNDGEAFFVSDRVSSTARVGKGGSFFSKSHNCRPANRRGQEFDVPIRSFGFRLALMGEPGTKRAARRRSGSKRRRG
jgi:formylglycine-generating enzyme required for sulfatase activity/tRNA A-37 threonylcarbamoyl transferase component Bud32